MKFGHYFMSQQPNSDFRRLRGNCHGKSMTWRCTCDRNSKGWCWSGMLRQTKVVRNYLPDIKCWLVVSTPLKNIGQLGWLFPIYGKIKNVPNHQPEWFWSCDAHASCCWMAEHGSIPKCTGPWGLICVTRRALLELPTFNILFLESNTEYPWYIWWINQ